MRRRGASALAIPFYKVWRNFLERNNGITFSHPRRQQIHPCAAVWDTGTSRYLFPNTGANSYTDHKIYVELFHILSHLDGRVRSTRSMAEARIELHLHSTRETPGLTHVLIQADISLIRFQGVTVV